MVPRARGRPRPMGAHPRRARPARADGCRTSTGRGVYAVLVSHGLLQEGGRERAGPGRALADADGTVRVMAIVEGYVVARRKGTTPFLMSVRQFKAAFTLAAPQKTEARS